MADKVQFDLVSPERRLASIEAREVRIPAVEGDLTAMPDHAPLITSLRPGVVAVTSAKGDAKYLVTGGFAEIGPGEISVLAERAFACDEITAEQYQNLVDEAREKLAKAQNAATDDSGPVDDAAKLLADMVAVGDEIGVGAR